MASGSSRPRIDQFFASKKKRKSLSPALESKRSGSEPKITTDGSPSAKGSLEKLLVISEDSNKSSQSAGDSPARRVPIKRNLTLEISSNSKTDETRLRLPTNGHSQGLNRFQEVNTVKSVTEDEVSLADNDSPDRRVPIKRNLTLEINSNSQIDDTRLQLPTDDHSQGLNRFEEINRVKVGTEDKVNLAEGNKDISETLLPEKSENCELKKFATSFLSLYCSELPSNMLSGLSVDGKRGHSRLSTGDLDSRPFKRQHTSSDGGQCIIEYGSTCHGDNKTEITDSSSFTKSRDAFLKQTEVTLRDMDTEPQVRLRKCGTVSSCCVAAGCDTPGSLSSKVRLIETPKSMRGSSMFSPGETFWNQAIQLADGLIAPSDNLAPHDPGNLQTGDQIRNLASLGYKGYGHKPENVLMRGTDRSSTLGLIPNVGAALNQGKRLVEEVSPLPVKHFDFCLEDNKLMEDTQACLQNKSHPVHRSKEVQHTSVNHEKFEAIRFPRDENTINDLLEVQKMPLECAVDEKEGKLVTEVPDSATSDKLGDKLKYTTSNSVSNHNDTPSSFTASEDRLELKHWLPPQICSTYKKRGISKLYQWQVDCLQVDGVLHSRNLVYCASTSAGKSFVAEILMLRRVLSIGKMALLVLPYVSICAEKAEHLELLLEPLNKQVRSYYGNQGGGSLPKDTSIAVCTIEKANSLINKLLEEGRLSELGIIVIDELHMVGDQNRGYLLELMLTKLRYAAGEGSESSSGESSDVSSSKTDPVHGLQIVGMSATMPNVAAVAQWLQAALFETDFRPVPLEEYIKVGYTIYNKAMHIVRTIPKAADLGGKDPDHIVELCNEVVQEGHSVLIFCSSRKGCESTARHVANYLKQLSTIVDRDQGILKDVSVAIDALRRSPAGLDPVLEETLPAGVAYHHAGLTVEERETIENCYRKGLVRVLTATSTLAAGVNLPARRVIFRQPRIGRDFIDGTRYKQMAGRAGRTGIDTKGESILICKQDEVKRITRLLNDSCTPLHSCLAEDKNGMTHAILEVVAGGIVQTANDIHRYVRCTLLNSTRSFEDVVKSAQESLRWLCQKRFLEWNKDTKLYNTTPLGRASFGSSLNPEESLIVLDDLNRAREGFVLASDLHLVYIVTPTNVEVEPDWELFYQRFMELSAIDQSVGNLVGVQEPFLMRMAHGAPLYTSHKRKEINSRGFQGNSVHGSNVTNKNVLSEEQKLRVSRRFYVSLILSRLVQEAPVTEVCDAFKVARGMVQSLQENAGRFASMVTVFCERLGWHDLEGLVAKFQNRVSFGVRAEIVELTTIPYIKGSRARALYKAGLRTPQAIAEASVSEIAKALFESLSWSSQGSVQRRMQLGVAKKIKNGARKIVLDKAEEARMAAFSAFKSLGIEVPPLSRPLLSTAAAAVPLNATSSGDNSTTSLPVLEDRRKVDRKISELVVETPKNVLLKTPLNVVDMPEEANSVAADQNEYVCKKIVDDNCSGSVVNVCYGLTDYGNGVSDSKPEQVRLHEGERKGPSSGSKEKAFEKGPLTMSSFPGGLDSLLDTLDHTQEFYFDVHFNKTSELNKPATSELHGIAICWENSPVYYINVPKDLFCSNSSKTEIMSSNPSACTGNASTPQNMDLAKSRWERVGSIMDRKDIRKVTWNLKGQTQVLKRPAVSIHRSGGLSVSIKSMGLYLINDSYFMLTPVFIQNAVDVSIVVWMLWPDEERSSNPNLEKVVKKRLSSEAAAAAAKCGRWKNQMRRAAHNGCCRRVAQIRSLTSVLWKLIIADELTEVLLNIENSLVHVLADMEFHGIGVDMESCLSARNVLARKLKSLEKEAYKLAGMKFSLCNTADIANILYEHLKLPLPEGLKKGKYHPSTDKHCLDSLRNEHPIVPVIKEHRTLGKLLNVTLGSICSLSKLSMTTQRYTLHGRWLQTSTATGRLSMEEPNLQCVERLVEFKMHTSGEHVDNSVADSYVVNARDFFQPTQDNMILVTADYSQIELRMMAHFSRDSSLIELLSKPYGDVFTMIAAKWTEKAESTISAQERDNTKRLIYGILYGMGASSLSEQLGCSKDVAAEKIHSFKRYFPGVASWLQEVVSTCLEKGYVKTLKGRKRFLAKIKSGNSKEKSKAQRQAVNSICQGSAADIIKIAMINIHSVIVEGANKREFVSPLAKKFHMLEGRCRILLQVHDELIMEADSSILKEAASLLKTCMESAASLLVPLQVKLKIGRTWGSLEPVLVEKSEDSACGTSS